MKTLQRLLSRDREWEALLAANPMVAISLRSLGTPKVRKRAAQMLELLADRELEALTLFDPARARLGWEYGALRQEIEEREHGFAGHDVLGVLEEQGLAQVVTREDSAGHFVAVEPGESDAGRLVMCCLQCRSEWRHDPANS